MNYRKSTTLEFASKVVLLFIKGIQMGLNKNNFLYEELHPICLIKIETFFLDSLHFLMQQNSTNYLFFLFGILLVFS